MNFLFNHLETSKKKTENVNFLEITKENKRFSKIESSKTLCDEGSQRSKMKKKQDW